MCDFVHVEGAGVVVRDADVALGLMADIDYCQLCFAILCQADRSRECLFVDDLRIENQEDASELMHVAPPFRGPIPLNPTAECPASRLSRVFAVARRCHRDGALPTRLLALSALIRTLTNR